VLTGLLIQVGIPTAQELQTAVINNYIEGQIASKKNQEADMIKMGWIYYNLGQYDKSRQLMKGVAQNGSLSAIYCLGLIDINCRLFDEGILKLEKVIAKSPDYFPARLALGKAYFELGYYSKAVEHIEKAIMIEPDNKEAKYWHDKIHQ
jgi:tetratricopeptide (TPR) repeat protein